MNIAITGANSSVGINLLGHISEHENITVTAGVRSEKAASTLPSSSQITPRVISYNNVDDLSLAMQNVDCVVHLAGILIENKGTKYKTANVEATAAVVDAAKKAGAKHLVFVSVVGADVGSSNSYFKSKGDAEKIVAESGLSATIIRTPILIGPGTAGASSIVWAASQEKAKLLGGGNYTMRPLDVDDLSAALLNSCTAMREGVATHELVGPEPILYSELIKKVSSLMDKDVTIASIPVWAAKLGAAITSRIKGGMSPTVIDVITMDEVVENNAYEKLGIDLTPLSKTLEKILTDKK
jgi:NADH dehydrogenase